MSQQIDYTKYYPFDNAYIDLEKLERLEIDGIFPGNFKTDSIYSYRFYAPNPWMNNFYQSAKYRGNSFTIEKDGSIQIKYSSKKKSIKIVNEDKNVKFENQVGSHFIIATNSGIIEAKKLSGENGYKIYKYNEDGKQLFKLSFEHTHIKKEGNTYYHEPYLNYFASTNDFMVFNSNNSKYPKTVLVDLKNGKVTIFEQTFHGVIRTDNEDNIPGFIQINENRKTFKTVILNNSWTAKLESPGSNISESLVVDNILILSFYHSIATGSSLYAYDLNDGKFIWKADVKQLLIEHSEYWNSVYLSLYKDRVILEGIEAGGKYVQIFDLKTGKRIYSSF